MNYQIIQWNDLSTKVNLSSFSLNNTIEVHAMFTYCDCFAATEKQFDNLKESVDRLIMLDGFKELKVVWKRYFLSDAHNQVCYIKDPEFTYSYVQQPPLNGTKVSIWVYFVSKAEVQQSAFQTILSRPAYTHYYHHQLHQKEGDVNKQTQAVFKNYLHHLQELNCTLKNNCLRTWIYIQGVDIHYTNMVDERKKYFQNEDLTHHTHYITSTGIEGSYSIPSVLFLMDAYAVKGLKKEQIKYLYAPSHLSPTYLYGVTFERGVYIDYGDRRHILISGTASINNKGEVMYPGDCILQLSRAFENIQELLYEADATINDLAQAIIYLRDGADYKNVEKYLAEHYPNLPTILVSASVCRPTWLIEIEGIAIKEIECQYPAF